MSDIERETEAMPYLSVYCIVPPSKDEQGRKRLQDLRERKSKNGEQKPVDKT